uniref:Transmembrane protein n=1 Tax=Plectus sambesii TaxID=2011161 RepID=A0A914WW67_9BILA
MSSTVEPHVRSLPIPAESERISSHQGDTIASSSNIRPLLGGPSDTRRAPFDGFVSAAFSALLAVLLAWRFLLFSDERALSDKHGGSIGVDSDQPSVIVVTDQARRPPVPRIEITQSTDDRPPMSSVDDCDEPSETAPLRFSPTNPFYDDLFGSDGESVIMADTEDATGHATGALEDLTFATAAMTTSDRPEHDDDNCMRESCSKCGDIEPPPAADDNQRDSSLRSVRKLLPTDVLVLALDRDEHHRDDRRHHHDHDTTTTTTRTTSTRSSESSSAIE